MLGLTVVGVVHVAGRAVPDVVQPAHPQRRNKPRESEADEQAAQQKSPWSSAAPAHLQEAAAELAPAGGRGPQGRGLRGKVAHNFAWFTAAVAAVFAVAAGPAWCSAAPTWASWPPWRTGGHQGEIGIVFLFWCAASVVGGLVYGAMHRPVSPILLLLGMAALTIPMGFATDTWTLEPAVAPAGLLCARCSRQLRRRWRNWWTRSAAARPWAGTARR